MNTADGLVDISNIIEFFDNRALSVKGVSLYLLEIQVTMVSVYLVLSIVMDILIFVSMTVSPLLQ